MFSDRTGSLVAGDLKLVVFGQRNAHMTREARTYELVVPEKVKLGVAALDAKWDDIRERLESGDPDVPWIVGFTAPGLDFVSLATCFQRGPVLDIESLSVLGALSAKSALRCATEIMRMICYHASALECTHVAAKMDTLSSEIVHFLMTKGFDVKKNGTLLLVL